MSALAPPDAAALEAAAARIAPHIRVTPLLSSPGLDRLAGRRVYVKAECLQHTGSFKYRGAKSAITRLMAEGGAAGVLAYSSGNHAQGVARAAREAGLPAVIVMPRDTPELKRDRTRADGAEIVLYDRFGEVREAIGQEIAEARGLAVIPPYDHPDVIAGQATVGRELAAQLDGLGAETADVVVCCGGGGLAAGIALALAEAAPGMAVRPAEPEGFDDTARSLAAGERLANPPGGQSICDAVLTPMPGAMTFPILRAHARPGLTASDAEVFAAMRAAMVELKLCLEPGGALALAATLFRKSDESSDPVVAIATGGNVDLAQFERSIA